MDYKDFMEYAFQKLHERGWLMELIPSSITETDIAEFEQEYLMELPVVLKLYLMGNYSEPPLFKDEIRMT